MSIAVKMSNLAQIVYILKLIQIPYAHSAVYMKMCVVFIKWKMRPEMCSFKELFPVVTFPVNA